MVLWYYSSYDSADLVVHGSYKSSGVKLLQWKISYFKRTNHIFIALYIYYGYLVGWWGNLGGYLLYHVDNERAGQVYTKPELEVEWDNKCMLR